MTRKEEIINAAYNEAEVERQLKMHPQVFEQGFVAGAKWADAHPHWADAHPHWISVEDELPKESGWYLVTCDIYWCGQSVALFSDERWWKCIEPTHWMPLPQLPKKGGEK